MMQPAAHTTRSAFFIVGPTAVGKSAVAQWLAEKRRAAILSADAMLVYRGLDIGTAKPAPADRGGVPYWGLDLADPDQCFSVGNYIRQVVLALPAIGGRELIVAGGTGLYIKCLTQGLDDLPPADPAVRDRAAALLVAGGVAALRDELKRVNPAALAALADPDNPRRLVRALERAAAPELPPRKWRDAPPAPVVGLRMAPEALRRRIERRAERMFAEGLPEEAAALRAKYPALSPTARQAIGYAEAFDLLDGRLTRDAAIRRTIQRTAQLAKRQMTWFRHQLQVLWVDVREDDPLARTAEAVEKLWYEHGPTPINI